jgi:LAO/AO transport system kinase
VAEQARGASHWQCRVAQVLRGERRALGRLCRALEELREPELRAELYAAVRAQAAAGPWIIGVTGAPGVGKSTLVSALLTQLRKDVSKLAVLAIDPTSPLGGGALLGDRIRMQQHHGDDGVFIHSAATHGASGGLSTRAHETVTALGLWGAEVVIVETVGVGQAELSVMHLADSTCVVLAPGMGDELQANKAGIMEVADVFVVNKADLPGADRVVHDVQGMLALGRRSAPLGFGHHAAHAAPPEVASTSDTGSAVAGEWTTPVLTSIASAGQGAAELLQALRAHAAWLATPAGAARRFERRRAAARERIENAAQERLRIRLHTEVETLVDPVARGELDPDLVALGLLRG